MTDYVFPEANPQGPVPAPNSIHGPDRPSARAGRELSAYGDKSYPEASVSQHAQARKNGPQSGDGSALGDFEHGM